ncbi:alpha/beta hydrolase [Bizionia arctica]|uniref:Alpha/beta hydrolase n=2 Tax=Bizionia arctica TaxID=1495645 RepID=A0A917GDU8_9FLAO|nr:alpha/beta hydrolase [Bizionia arctica]
MRMNYYENNLNDLTIFVFNEKTYGLMGYRLKKEKEYRYIEVGEGIPIIVLHGLMGGLSNFESVTQYFSAIGYKVVIPELPIYTMSLLKTNVKSFAKYLHDFIEYKGFDEVILLGNSLGGHIGLYHTKLYPKKVKALIITGSSGLYESAMGGGYTKRSDYEVIKKKAQDVFYDPEVATKEIVDEVYETVNDRNKLIKTLAIAKSAIRHNMAKDLPKMKVPTCIIWGKNDTVTPPEVAVEFNELLPDSELFWIDKCGHAAMMERPDQFNDILNNWLKKRNF